MRHLGPRLLHRPLEASSFNASGALHYRPVEGLPVSDRRESVLRSTVSHGRPIHDFQGNSTSGLPLNPEFLKQSI